MILGHHIPEGSFHIDIYQKEADVFDASVSLNGVIVGRAHALNKDTAVERAWQGFRNLVVIRDHTDNDADFQPAKHLGRIRV